MGTLPNAEGKGRVMRKVHLQLERTTDWGFKLVTACVPSRLTKQVGHSTTYPHKVTCKRCLNFIRRSEAK